MYCPQCGVQAPNGANFCASCGHRLTTDASVDPAQTKPPQAAVSFFSPNVWRLLGRKSVFGIVLVARVLALIVGIWQIVGLLPMVMSPSLYEWGLVTWTVVLIKGLILAVCCAVFFGLRSLVRSGRKSKSSSNSTAECWPHRSTSVALFDMDFQPQTERQAKKLYKRLLKRAPEHRIATMFASALLGDDSGGPSYALSRSGWRSK
jgi:hypothetical protein